VSDAVREAARHAIAAARAAGADDVEISYASRECHFVRFASSRFTQVGQTENKSLRIRAIRDKRLGTQMCATTRTDAVEAAARAAVDAAAMAPRLDVAFGFSTGSGSEDVDSPYLPVPAALSAIEAPGRLQTAFDAHPEAKFAGALKVVGRQVGVLTSGGVDRSSAHVVYDLGVIAEDAGSTGYAGASGPADAPPDLAATAQRARDIAGRGKDPMSIDPLTCDVVLAPEAVAELLEWMAMASFGGNKILDETSLLCGRRGTAICDARITVSDEIADGEPSFDAEGMDRRRVGFIEAGIAGEPMTDRLTAARMATESTGHASGVDCEFASGPTLAHLRMAPGDASEAELIGSVDRGLYVTRLHYVNGLLDTRQATTTGMTRDGAFLIEGGKLGRGIRNLRFTERMVTALGRVGGIGSAVRDVPTWWSNSGLISVPALLIGEFHFTGKSR
jgi:predicted Zn-dependent protease